MAGGVTPWRPPRYTNAHFAEEQKVCYDLRLRGMSIRAIAEVTGLSKSTVANRIECEIRETIQPLSEQVRAMELERLDRAQQIVANVIDQKHYVVSEGRIVKGPDGEPLVDTGATLAALDRWLKILDRRAKYYGLDVTKIEATVTETTQQDIELAAMIREAQAKSAATEQTIKESHRGVSGPSPTG